MQAEELEMLYRNYCRSIFRLAFTYVKNEEDAKDIMQEVFVKRIHHKGAFESNEHEKAWLIRVTINLSKDHVKSFWHRKRASMEEYSGEYFGIQMQGDRQLMEELLALPKKCKAVIYLHYFEGYTCKEIGQMLGIGESAVKMRLKKGRELLKLALVDGKEKYL